jgi:hypothetical protein
MDPARFLQKNMVPFQAKQRLKTGLLVYVIVVQKN